MERLKGTIVETIFRNNPNDIYTGLIPSLVDRIMIRDKKVQKYGTHWLLDKSGKPFLVELEEYKKMLQLAESKEIDVIELIESEDLFSLEAKGGGFND